MEITEGWKQHWLHSDYLGGWGKMWWEMMTEKEELRRTPCFGFTDWMNGGGTT